MKRTKVNFTFQSRLLPDNIKINDLKKAVKSIVNYVLISERKLLDSVNLLFCDDLTIIEYNKKYLKHNYETDIITFKYDDESGISESDIIISLETVKRNSYTYKSGYLIELIRVLIHGCLHICGMDDNTPKKRILMKKKENHYLKLTGLLK